jgi:hypothetical protein
MTKSLSFSASTDSVTIPYDADTLSFSGTDQITILGWINPRKKAVILIRQSTEIILRVLSTGSVEMLLNSFSTNDRASGGSIKLKNWNFISGTYDGTTIKSYLNGLLVGSATPTGTYGGNTTNFLIGAGATDAEDMQGLIKNLQIFNRALTQAEIQDIMYDGKQPSDYATSITRHFDFENDTSTTIYDADDITKTGTITGAVFTQDVPPCGTLLGTRPYPGKNLFVSKIDGSAGISPTGTEKTTSGWIEDQRLGFSSNTSGSVSAKYDSTVKRTGQFSLKLSTTNTGSYIEGHLHAIPTVLSSILSCDIPCKPLTTYTLEYYMKTNYVSGDSNSGATLAILEYGISTASDLSTNYPSFVKITTDWTKYTKTFTTGAKTRFLDLRPTIYGHTGAATLIMDAWFDINSLTLTETIPERTAAGNRLAVRDMGTSLSFDGVNDKVDLTARTFSSGITLAVWFKTRTPKPGSSIELVGRSAGSSDVFEIQASGFLRFNILTDAGALNNTAGVWKFDMNWHLAVATYDSVTGNNIIYVDGVAVSTTSTTAGTLIASTNNALIWNIGSLGPSRYFKGRLDEARFWNRALSATEISNLYCNNIVPSGLVGEWLFDEGSGTTALDTSGNGNNGNITGATYTTDVPIKPRTNP